MYNALNKTIMIISFIGILFGVWLISMDVKSPGFCPKVLFIPACYLVSIAFFLVYSSSYFLNKKTSDMFFYIGNVLGLVLAVWFSFAQIINLQECPKLLNIPLCYVSFLTFLFLLVLHLIKNFIKSE
jgi:hypothetical protein